MPFHNRYNREFDIILQVTTSPLSIEEMIAKKRIQFASGWHGPKTGLIADARELDVDATWMKQYSTFLDTEYAHITTPGAIVAEAAGIQALTQYYATLEYKVRARRVQTFLDFRNAVEWLGRDPDLCTAEALGFEV